MLSVEKNALLCKVSKGTPMGEVFRSIWIPALPAEQIPNAGGSPVRLRLLGEDLIAFRDGNGNVGVVQAQCAHRLAPLFFGRVEQNGIRCAYHGLLFDATGKCQEIPSDPGNAALCARMSIQAYRVMERSDIVWVFMGDGEPPEAPQLPWMSLPASSRMAAAWVQETNWLQGLEGDLDSSHVSILHKSKSLQHMGTMLHQPYTYLDSSPRLFTQNTDIGFMSVARRRAEEQFYWRVSQFMMPMFALTPGAIWPHTARAWVPIDDENTYTWNFSWSEERPIPDDYKKCVENGELFPPSTVYRSYRLNSGSMIDAHIPMRTSANNYEINRVQQAEDGEISGIWGVNDQDRAMQEGMGRIANRSRERLLASDLTVTAARRRLLELVASAEGLTKFREAVADGTAYSMSPMDKVHPASDVKEFLIAEASL